MTHERWNSKEVDFGMSHGIVDKFTLKELPDLQKKTLVAKQLEIMLDSAGGRAVTGDVGHTNSQMMESYLQADERVVLVVQTRDPASYAQSVMDIHPTPARWETFLMRGRGIDATKFPNRRDRLKAYCKSIETEGKALLRKYGPARVEIIDVKALNTQGPKLLQKLGLVNSIGPRTWDNVGGRNARKGNTGRLQEKIDQKKNQP